MGHDPLRGLGAARVATGFHDGRHAGATGLRPDVDREGARSSRQDLRSRQAASQRCVRVRVAEEGAVSADVSRTGLLCGRESGHRTLARRVPAANVRLGPADLRPGPCGQHADLLTHRSLCRNTPDRMAGPTLQRCEPENGLAVPAHPAGVRDARAADADAVALDRLLRASRRCSAWV